MNNQVQRDNQKNNDSTSSTGGGGFNFSGTIERSAGVVVGQNITVGDIMVDLDQSIQQNPNNEYFKGLKELTEKLSKEYEKFNVPEEKRKEINQSIQDLQTEVKDLPPATTVEEKPATTVEEKPATTVEEKPATTVEEKPATTVEEKPATTVENINEDKQQKIKTKTKTLVEKIVDSLPETSETIANLVPFLSPFSKFIKGGVQNLVDAYKKYKESQS